MDKKKAKIISMHNNKGGVLKTTLAVNVGSKLFKDGNKVLIVDLDGQGNVVGAWNQNANKLKYSIHDVFTGNVDVHEAIVEQSNGLDVLPANRDMFLFENDFMSGNIKVKLNKIIKSLESEYDYIIIDTPASQGLNTTGALKITNTLVIPFTLEPWGVSGVKDLIRHLNQNILSKDGNMKKILLVPTMFVANSRNQIDGLTQITEAVKSLDKIFNISKYQITRSVAVSNAMMDHHMPIMLTSKKNKVKTSMENITQEVIK